MKLTAMEYHQIGRFVVRKLKPEAVKTILESYQQEKNSITPDPERINRIFSSIQDKRDKPLIFIGTVYKIYDPYALGNFKSKHIGLIPIIASVLGRKPNDISKLLSIVRVKYQHVKSFNAEIDSYAEVSEQEFSTIETNLLETISNK